MRILSPPSTTWNTLSTALVGVWSFLENTFTFRSFLKNTFTMWSFLAEIKYFHFLVIPQFFSYNLVIPGKHFDYLVIPGRKTLSLFHYGTASKQRITICCTVKVWRKTAMKMLDFRPPPLENWPSIIYWTWEGHGCGMLMYIGSRFPLVWSRWTRMSHAWGWRRRWWWWWYVNVNDDVDDDNDDYEDEDKEDEDEDNEDVDDE